MYMAAPSQSGKSAAVLPGFLRAVELNLGLTHYLYMPFFFNGGQCHGGVICCQHMDERALESVGAQYMLACFQEQAFNVGYLELWLAPEKPENLRQTERKFAAAVDRFLDKSPGGVILIHLDEHPKICASSAVRRGALSLLTSVGNRVRVIATHTDVPDLPAEGSSSAVCRAPVAKPIVDVSELMCRRPVFARLWMLSQRNGDERWQLASLRVSLGLAPTSISKSSRSCGSCELPGVTEVTVIICGPLPTHLRPSQR